MNLKSVLPAAALLVLLMPSNAWSRNHNDYNDAGLNGNPPQAGTLTPFSNTNNRRYLSGNVDQYSNGYDPDYDNLGQNQYGAYGNSQANSYGAGAYLNNNSMTGMAHVHEHGGCHSQRSQIENALRAQGIDPRVLRQQSGFQSALNNPSINPYANPYVNGLSAPYGNPYAAAVNRHSHYGF